MKNYIVWSYLWLYQCKACKREKIYAKRLSNRSTQEGALEVIYKQILQSARQRDLSCDLTEKDIQAMWDKQDGKCYYSGYPMEYNFVGSKPWTFSEKTKYQISMDRKNNAIWYLKSNCILCCTFINKMKWTLDDKEFVKVCKDIIARS
jgi:hypothetical protein